MGKEYPRAVGDSSSGNTHDEDETGAIDSFLRIGRHVLPGRGILFKGDDR